MENESRYVTNHVRVFQIVKEHEDLTAAQISLLAKITERTVLKILSDLAEDGYIEQTLIGRKTRKTIKKEIG